MVASIAQLGSVTPKNRTATQVVLDAAARAGHSLRQVFGVGGGDHAGGLATDFMVYEDKAAGDWIANWVWAHRDQLGVRWIIWQQKIISINPKGVYGPAGQWNPMENRGSVTQNHMDHVHVMWDSSPVEKVVDLVTKVAAAINGLYTVQAGDTLGEIASNFKVSVDQLVKWNGVKNPNVISVGQKIRITAPASAVPVSKPAPKPQPAPTGGARPWLIPGQNGVYPDKLRPGVKDSTSVYLYQLALRRYLNKYAAKYNPSGATGYYGDETIAMTRAVYRDLAKKAGGNGGGWAKWDPKKRGWVSNDTWPGPKLLGVLGLRNLGHS